MNHEYKVKILESGGFCCVLLYLLDHPEGVQRVQYRFNLGLSPRAAMRNHNLLFAAGLIESKPSKDKLLFGLTEKGEKIARLLASIEDLL